MYLGAFHSTVMAPVIACVLINVFRLYIYYITIKKFSNWLVTIY